MARMFRGGADIAGVGAIVFEEREAGAVEESVDVLEVVFAPLAAQAWRVAEGGAAGLAGLGIDTVALIIHPAAGQQRIAAQFHALAPGVIRKFLELRDIC